MTKPHALLVLLLMSHGSVAHALTTDECVDAHVAAQKRRAESKLLEAREALALCGAAECPGVLRGECGAWLLEVNRDIPSIVPVVVTPDGSDVGAPQLLLDGTAHVIQAGAATDVDPGPHKLQVIADGYRVVTLPFTANVGARERRLEVTLVPIERSAPSWPYFALGGGVVLGVGAFAGLGAAARADEKDLSDCRPRCSDGDIEKVRWEYVGANVGLGLAAASLAGAGAYFLFTRSSVTVRPETTGSVVYYSTQF